MDHNSKLTFLHISLPFLPRTPDLQEKKTLYIKSHYIWQTFDIVVPIIHQQETHMYNSGTDHQPKGVVAHCPVGHVGKSQTMDKL